MFLFLLLNNILQSNIYFLIISVSNYVKIFKQIQRMVYSAAAEMNIM